MESIEWVLKETIESALIIIEKYVGYYKPYLSEYKNVYRLKNDPKKSIVWQTSGDQEWVERSTRKFEYENFNSEKLYHVVKFIIGSQGREVTEWYRIGINEDADMIGRKLVKWFNLTGGNNDGSERTFIRTDLNFIGTPYEFMRELSSDPDHCLISYINELNINLSWVEI